MELNRLRYFHVVAREGSFTQAARVLRVQQPALSKMVRQLEGHLGLALLERHPKGVTLTPIGAEIFEKCRVLFDQVEEIRALADGQLAECQGPLSIGATDSVASHLLPQVLSDFLRDHPRVSPSLFSGASNLVTREMAEGRVELGVFFTVPDGDFRVAELAEVPFQLVASPALSPAEAMRRGFVLSREVDYPKARPFPVLEMLRRQGLDVRVAVACNQLDAQKMLVSQGLGVALLPSFMVREELASGRLQALLPRKPFRYSLKLVTPRRKSLSKSARAFMVCLERALQRLGETG
jgi:DNA-binding transcriptional LysR family regulator